MRAQEFHVGDQVAGGVHRQVGAVGDVRAGLSAAPLIEQHDPVPVGVEEAALGGTGAAAGSAVHEHDGFAAGRTRCLPVDELTVSDVEEPGVIGCDRRIEVAHGDSHL